MMADSNLQVLQSSDLQSVRDRFAADVREGLSASPKRLNCKYLYDERGAALFEQICTLDEYYPTRTEVRIMRRHAREMAAAIGPQVVLVELGSGSAEKTRLLLDHMPGAVGYIPIDIAQEQLFAVAEAIAGDYPHLAVEPVCADFSSGDFTLPKRPSARSVIYFPGSTIGNFEPVETLALLERLRRIAGPGGGLLIGVDLKKDPGILHAAYNDAAGVTAAFNLNLLHRINRDLAGTFATESFAHYAFYNPRPGRIEMHLLSRRRQVVSAAGERFEFRSGESILTEASYKHEPHEFARLAATAGFELHHTWTDEKRWFAVQLYSCDHAATDYK
jgi:L-histidine N-alpha-methyltransferase